MTMTGSKSPLVVEGLDTLFIKVRELGAIEGSARLEAIRAHYEQLTPYSAYLWLNPTAIQEEIEEAQIQRGGLHLVYILRNIFSLAPLITTWFALFTAVNAYQRDVLARPGDTQVPFLQLWQSGFHGLTGFTFAWAAGLDVILLFFYLICILILHEAERRAHTRAVDFFSSNAWKKPLANLMEAIDSVNRPYVANKSDIDNVVDAVDRIIKTATDSLNKTVTMTTVSMQDTVNKIASEHKQSMQMADQSFRTFIANAQQALTQVVTSSEQTTNSVTASAQAAITGSNEHVEKLFVTQVKPLIDAFQRDLTALQGELRNYQGRLDDLTKASQMLADVGLKLGNASNTLEENAGTYLVIGQDMKAQLAALRTIQEDVLFQIGTVAGGISSAAGSMTTATTNMVAAMQEVKNVAWQLDNGMQTTINTVSTNIGQVSQSLERVVLPLEAASSRLYTAANLLASIRLFPFFRRRPQQPQGHVS